MGCKYFNHAWLFFLVQLKCITSISQLKRKTQLAVKLRRSHGRIAQRKENHRCTTQVHLNYGVEISDKNLSKFSDIFRPKVPWNAKHLHGHTSKPIGRPCGKVLACRKKAKGLFNKTLGCMIVGWMIFLAKVLKTPCWRRTNIVKHVITEPQQPTAFPFSTHLVVTTTHPRVWTWCALVPAWRSWNPNATEIIWYHMIYPQMSSDIEMDDLQDCQPATWQSKTLCI